MGLIMTSGKFDNAVKSSVGVSNRDMLMLIDTTLESLPEPPISLRCPGELPYWLNDDILLVPAEPKRSLCSRLFGWLDINKGGGTAV